MKQEYSNWYFGFGISAWVVFLVFPLILKDQPINWPVLILGFGILTLVPGALFRLQLLPFRIVRPFLTCALLAVLAYLFESSALGFALSFPYLLLTLWLLFYRFRENGYVFSLEVLALVYLVIAASWLVAERTDFRPFGFDPMISLLTAVHFHFAGFLLTGLSAILIKSRESKTDNYLKFALVVGAPMVAIGITLTHFQGPFIVESFAACWMALTGIWISIKFLRTPVHWLIIPGGLLLFIGMLLAIAYGIRVYYPFDFLSIPWMYRVHGTINCLSLSLLWAGLFWKRST